MTSTTRTIDAELLLDARADLGESPVWDDVGARLLWVDIDHGVVHELDVGSGLDRATEVGPTVGAVALRASGGRLLARNHGVSSLDPDGTVAELVEFEGEAGRDGHRMNDGKCDPAGRFWAGSIVTDKSGPGATLYRVDPDLTSHVMRAGVSVSNGLGWNPEADTMYYIDSLAGGVDVYRYDRASGDITNCRRFVDIEFEHGEPDGLTVDAEGCVWFAIWRAGEIRRYTPAGELDTVVRVPASLTTSCCFGGADLDTLFITTASCDLTPEQRGSQPHAGSIFACRPGVTGLPTTPFAG